MRAPDFVSILYRWREWAGAEEVNQWIRRIVDTDDGLSNFIDNCLGKVVSHTITDRVARISYRLDPSLQDFIGTDELAIRLDRLVQGGRWSEERKLAVEHFLRERRKSNSPQNP